MTDSKRYERALIERNEALVVGDRLKSQFISHVSYELRTPLTNIIGFSELLTSPRTGDLNDKQREYLNDISASSRTLLAIINDILDLTTIDAGAMELKLTPVKVAGLVDGAVLGVRDRAARARLNIDIRIADDAHEFIADEARVRQVLYNLLSNAIGFSKPGDAIRINAWREAGMMAFAVEDQGVGIPKEEQVRVFERFESRSQGSKHRGAGLGPFDREEPGGAARRRHVAGIGARSRHTRDSAFSRRRRARGRSRGREPPFPDPSMHDDGVDARSR